MERRQWLAERPPLRGPDAERPSVEGNADTTVAAAPVVIPFGSQRARVLAALAELASPFGLQVAPVATDGSRFAVRVSDAAGADLTLFVEAPRPDARYYRRNDRLGLWYPSAGANAEPPWIGSLLSAAAALLLAPAAAGIADEITAARPETDEPSTAATAPAQPYARPRVLGPGDVENFFHVDYEYDPGAEVDQPPTCRIGVIYQCNQTCTFCQLAEMNTHIPPERIYAALDASRARGATRVIITGGEPTMCKHLVDYMEYATRTGFSTIEMQTNATVLDNPERAARVRRAGLTDAQVSLHGPDSAVSDRLTAAPGTHKRTLAGIGNLLDLGVRVLLNHLIFRDNCHLLLDYVEMVEQLWGRHRDRLILQFHAPLNEFARIDVARRHIARYSDYALQLAEAIDRARALGYSVRDLQDPTGIPALCILGADSHYLGPIVSQRSRPRLHRYESDWMTRVEACRTCEIADACIGIPKVYLALHGDEEFHPIKLRDIAAGAAAAAV